MGAWFCWGTELRRVGNLTFPAWGSLPWGSPWESAGGRGTPGGALQPQCDPALPQYFSTLENSIVSVFVLLTTAK